MTRKLTLDLESVSIESFESGSAADLDGTVQGHDAKMPCVISGAQPYSCPPSWDCYEGPANA
jgi:hypothetical protein